MSLPAFSLNVTRQACDLYRRHYGATLPRSGGVIDPETLAALRDMSDAQASVLASFMGITPLCLRMEIARVIDAFATLLAPADTAR